jgi:hypothetical protein
MRVDAIASGFGEETRALGCAIAFKAKPKHGTLESSKKVVVRNSEHDSV